MVQVSMVASDVPVVFVAELGLNGVLFDYTFITQSYYQQVNYYVREPVFLANWFTSPYFGYELKKADEVPKEDDTKGTSVPYMVRVKIPNLNIRTGPGTDHPKTGKFTGAGSFTIVEEAEGRGASKWGKLKSGAGWISLDYGEKIVA